MKRIRSWACGGSNVKSSNWVILLLVRPSRRATSARSLTTPRSMACWILWANASMIATRAGRRTGSGGTGVTVHRHSPIRQRKTVTFEDAVRGQIDSPRTPLALGGRFRKCLKRATRCSFRTPGGRRPSRQMRRGHISQFARRISTCAKCRAPRKDVATRTSRAPIMARAGTHGAAQAPLAGYLGLASKRLRRLAGRRR